MTEAALAAQALQYLPLVVTEVEKLWQWIEGVRAANQQSAEWTPEIEAAYQQRLLERTKASAYQPDPVATPPPQA
jgi:hypothetical protein